MKVMPPREPTVDEMLADPIVRLVMRRDGVEEQEVRRILRLAARGRARLFNGQDDAAASQLVGAA